jgi:hypothetical protein
LQPPLFPLEKVDRRYTEAFPETSREAYESVDIAAEQARVYDLVARAGTRGLTADEVEARGGRGGHQRFAELRRIGALVPTGLKRRTRAGKWAKVYCCSEYAANR